MSAKNPNLRPGWPSAIAVAVVASLALGCGGKATIDVPLGGGGSTGSTSSGTGGAAGAGGGGAVVCNPGGVACLSPAPACAPGEVPSVEGACWGPCVPILSCATEPSCAGCSTGFCAAYVAWTTEYRCVLPYLQCSSTACGCVAPYFCAGPFDACIEGSGSAPFVSCECSTC